jgi:hypothetical protein
MFELCYIIIYYLLGIVNLSVNLSFTYDFIVRVYFVFFVSC